MGWQKIAKDKPLQPGDRVRLHFNAYGPTWMKATEAAIIEQTLKGREGYELRSIDYWTPGKMIFEFNIVQTNPVIVTVLVITGSVLLIGAAIGLVFESAEQLFETPAAVVGSVGFVIIAIVILLSVLSKRK